MLANSRLASPPTKVPRRFASQDQQPLVCNRETVKFDNGFGNPLWFLLMLGTWRQGVERFENQ
ncbi:MAG: hypothetical protein OXO49_00675 [Gammaproteobacteria bacterium]|nr:hypothetical protein [Gammaproteobacteria bacterium]